MRYCPACRIDFPGDTPPYSVIHTQDDPARHLVPITREEIHAPSEASPAG